MFGLGRWPYYPGSLSEVIDPIMLTYIEAGASERLSRPLTILDYDSGAHGFTHRIESIAEDAHYEEYCRCLRRIGPADQACLGWDLQQAQISLQHFRETGDAFRSFPCHMGLVDMSLVVEMYGQPVALLLTGQYRPPEGAQAVIDALDGAAGQRLNPAHREELRALTAQLRPAPGDAREQLQKEAATILRFAEAEYRTSRHAKEEDFLDILRAAAAGPMLRNREDLTERVEGLLDRVRGFVRCEYLLFFGAVMEDDTVLAPVASCNLSEAIDGNLPHFNWRKANLPLENFDLNKHPLLAWRAEALARGLRGENAQFFQKAALAIPYSLGDRFRGVLVFGPFQDRLNLAGEDEQRFLKEVTSVIALFCLSSMQVIALDQERKRWQNTAKLLTHQIKTSITSINTDIGRARAAIGRPGRPVDFRHLDDLLRQAEDRAMTLSASTTETFTGSFSLLNKDDLVRETSHLSALVANCAAGFLDQAQAQNREIEIDRSVEMLPEADVDVARLTIALQNLIENALKYSYSETTIRVRSRIDYASDGGMIAVIDVSDLGREIRESERDQIFLLGVRGTNVLAALKSRARVPGSGLGLWQTRMIIQAHGGTINVSCSPTSIYRRDRRAYHVVFTVTIPLRQGRGA